MCLPQDAADGLSLRRSTVTGRTTTVTAAPSGRHGDPGAVSKLEQADHVDASNSTNHAATRPGARRYTPTDRRAQPTCTAAQAAMTSSRCEGGDDNHV